MVNTALCILLSASVSSVWVKKENQCASHPLLASPSFSVCQTFFVRVKLEIKITDLKLFETKLHSFQIRYYDMIYDFEGCTYLKELFLA